MAVKSVDESDLDAGIALVETVVQDLRNAQAEIADFDKYIEATAGLAGIAVAKSKELADSLGAAPESMQERVVEAVQAPIDSVVTDFSATMKGLEQELLNVLQTDGGQEAVLDAVETITDWTATLKEKAIDKRDQLLGASATTNETLNDLVSVFNGLSDGFQGDIDKLFEEFEDFINLEIIEPITQEGEWLVAEWSELITSELSDLVEETMQKVSQSIETPVAEAIDALEDAGKREIEALRELFTTGNDATDATRVVLEEATETIKSAIEPLEAALDAFKGLAGVVGVKL